MPCFDIRARKWAVEQFVVKDYAVLAQLYNVFVDSEISRECAQCQQLTTNTTAEGQMQGQFTTESPFTTTGVKKPTLYLPSHLTSMVSCQARDSSHILYIFGGVYLPHLAYTSKLWKVNFN